MMKNEASAEMASGLLNLLKGATRLIPEQNTLPQDREAIRNFQNMIVDRDGNVLLIRFRMPPEALVQRGGN